MRDAPTRSENFRSVEPKTFEAKHLAPVEQKFNDTHRAATTHHNRPEKSHEVKAILGGFSIEPLSNDRLDWNPSGKAVSNEKPPESIGAINKERQNHAPERLDPNAEKRAKIDGNQEKRKIEGGTLFKQDGKQVALVGAIHDQFEGIKQLQSVLRDQPKNTQIMMEFVTKPEADKINSLNDARQKLTEMPESNEKAQLQKFVNQQEKAVKDYFKDVFGNSDSEKDKKPGLLVASEPTGEVKEKRDAQRAIENKDSREWLNFIEAAGDSHLKITGAEPDIDHLFAYQGSKHGAGGYQAAYEAAGEARFARGADGSPNPEVAHDFMNYAQSKGELTPELSATKDRLDKFYKGNGWNDDQRNELFKTLDTERNADHQYDWKSVMTQASKDFTPMKEAQPNKEFFAARQTFRNDNWADGIDKAVHNPNDPNAHIIVIAGSTHFHGGGANLSSTGRFETNLTDRLNERKIGNFRVSNKNDPD